MSATDKQALLDIHELLTRLYLRNRNQHHDSHWFGPLDMFRKQLGLLLGEIDGAKGVAKGSRVRIGNADVKAVLESRLEYWDRVVHDWYL